MTTASKGLKDKPLTSAPRLVPRQTAASAARAARNASNRNLIPPTKQSPARSPVSSPKLHVKGLSSSTHDSSKLDEKKFPPESGSYIIDDPSKVLAQSLQDQPIAADGSQLPQVVTTEPLDGAGTYNIVADSGLTSADNADPTATDDDSQSLNDSKSERAESIKGQSISLPKALKTTNLSVSSRPSTPKSSSSRPQTPRVLSRPPTPKRPSTHHNPTATRPNTPQRSSGKTLLTSAPSLKGAAAPMVSFSEQPLKEEEDVKSTFVVKLRKFNRMKKELDLKQLAVLEELDKLRTLREQMVNEGVSAAGEGFQLNLEVFNVADWTSEEVAQLCRDAAASSSVTDGAIELITGTLPIDECALSELDAKVMNMPTRFAELCLQAFTARQEIIDWTKELIEHYDPGNTEFLERVARYNAQGLNLCESLRTVKSLADEAVHTISQLTKRTFHERSALIDVGESLVREAARLRQEMDSHSTAIKELQAARHEDQSKAHDIVELRRELEEEQGARNALKDKLANTETQLRQARGRVSKMDRQLREAEASIASLTGNVKSLEDQSRQKEVQLEARARKLKESLKTGEVTSNQLAHHRDALQSETQELRQQIENMNAQHKETIQDLSSQLKETSNLLAEQRKITLQEIEQRETAEANLAKIQQRVEELTAKVTELETNRPNPDMPTEREIDLWAELQATKDTLRMLEEEVTACKREKVRFLETLTKITESENKVGIQQKLAAELLSKEEILSKMQIQIRDLTKSIKLNEQKVVQYEQYVRDLQAHNRSVSNCPEAPDGPSYEDLQQEIMNLRMGLLEAVHRNDELVEQLVQKEQHLEQQDKTSRAQARVIKVREELINMLKNKETEQSRELAALQQDLEHRMKIVDEVNRQIAAKADEIQELFVTLENKQQQIHRLEKIVLALEEQQRRAQAQRTRHEEKIAALEHELAATGNRRDRKFLFF